MSDTKKNIDPKKRARVRRAMAVVGDEVSAPDHGSVLRYAALNLRRFASEYHGEDGAETQVARANIRTLANRLTRLGKANERLRRDGLQVVLVQFGKLPKVRPHV